MARRRFLNIYPELDVELLDIGLLALMASEDIQQAPILLPGLEALSRLKQQVAPLVQAVDEAERVTQLLQAFYGELGFHGDWEHFFCLDNCLLERVVAKRSGIPVTLGVLLIYLARWLSIPVEGICFPGHFMVRFGRGKQAKIVDPFSGAFLSRAELSVRLRGCLGDLAQLQGQHLNRASQADILTRLLTVTKATAIQADEHLLALRCSELLLCLEPDDPYEIRDRGLLYEQLECSQLAADDLSFFIEQCPHDPVTEMLKEQLARLDNSAPTLH
ncbi:MAG: SirB1 family protein [Aeromonadaceae bacterium]